MPVYEVEAAGFDGSEATDDRVIWVNAVDEVTVRAALEGLDAKVCGEVPGTDPSDVDFDLSFPNGVLDLRAALSYFQRRRPRPEV